MRICIINSTNRIIEMQSDAQAGTLLQNAVNAGYRLDDITEQEVTDAQYELAKKIDPVFIAASEAKIAISEAVESLGKYDADIDAIKDVEGVKPFLKKLSQIVYNMNRG